MSYKMSFKRSALLGIAALSLFATPTMYADMITTFTVTGVTADSATISGDVIIDVTTGVVQSASVNASSPISLTGLAFDSPDSQFYSGEYALFTTPGGVHSSASFIELAIPVTTLIGYTGGSLCTGSCGTTNSFAQNGTLAVNSFITSGSLTATTTPEPASVVLVGSALLGLFALRRRIAR